MYDLEICEDCGAKSLPPQHHPGCKNQHHMCNACGCYWQGHHLCTQAEINIYSNYIRELIREELDIREQQKVNNDCIMELISRVKSRYYITEDDKAKIIKILEDHLINPEY